ncbi:MAG: hypothetical protein GY780_15460 [bacterium]|nr:hypothetical protein [bacterium]
MYGRSQSTVFFSGNSVATNDSSMARRRGVVSKRFLKGFLLVMVVGLIMAGRIFLTNQITGLRARVADLESQREFLEAGSAKLHWQWNCASNSKAVVQRAEDELGLVLPQTPGPVLVCMGKDPDDKTTWKKMGQGLMQGDLAAVSNEAGQVVTDVMISLEPRSAHAASFDRGVD